jgi:uncharacterized cupin superfamily protein
MAVSKKDARLQLPAIDPDALPSVPDVPDYPREFWGMVIGSERRRLGDAAGLKNFGVNLVRLPPGCASSQRHWHTRQDELIYVLSGELVLVTDAGEQVLGPGTAAGFPAGKPDGHHVINRSQRDAIFLEIGDRSPGDEGEYPDIDMKWKNVDGGQRYVYIHKDGTPY